MILRVLIAEHEPVFQVGLDTILTQEPGYTVVGIASNGLAVVQAARLHDADVVLLDVGLPGPPNSQELVHLLHNQGGVGIILIGSDDDVEQTRKILAVGALGCIHRDIKKSELFTALRSVSSGHRYLDEKSLKDVIFPKDNDETSECADIIHFRPITPREQDVCQLLAYGYTNNEVAAKLGISDRTVETHRANIMRKLSLKTRADLVHFALDHGLLKCPEEI